ncbi:ABC transporter ATP-binding protein [Johnsonella ignava]|uniref:ABC transporter ATP-binding protein n=1 Tax=Johnsonella ignava TaxID=43995 RepID=UPI0023F1BD9D|nr:ABC transporter ATP-binding protein [Johnsonella ignava]
MSKNNILIAEHISMQFGGVLAINDLSINVGLNEIVALIGPNGAGKTTAFNCITGIYEPTVGKIVFDGHTVIGAFPKNRQKKDFLGTLPEHEIERVSNTPDRITRKGMARTFQNIRLFGNLSVIENVLIAKHTNAKQNVFSAVLRLNSSEEKRMLEESKELLDMQGLIEYKDERAGSLPYGLQRRLEIARALALDPKLLLLDEPAAGMNPQETHELTELISKIRDDYKLGIFMIEHHMDLVMGISDRVYVLDFGKLIAEGTPDEIQNNEHVIDAYLGVVEENA